MTKGKLWEIAKVVYEQEARTQPGLPPKWESSVLDDEFFGNRQRYIDRARLVIAAMKNPTPAMRDAFLRNTETGATPSDEDSVEFTLNFNAAIDAALKETP